MYKSSLFEQLPQLLYITNTQGMREYFPRMLHKHKDHLEIVFIAKGRGTHIIGDTKYDTKAGDILIFNQNVLHDEMAQIHSEMVTYCCGIGNLKIKGMERNCLFDLRLPAVISSGKHQDTIEKIIDMMFCSVKNAQTHAREFSNYLLFSLLTLIVSLPQNTVQRFFYKKFTLVDQVKDYIEQHYTQALSVDHIAHYFNISPSYLSHLFKRESKFPLMQYVNRRRIGEAQSLLMTTKYSITQIALMVGYENINYFSTAFTKMLGITPTQYRRQWIGKELTL
ncbi:AraC family transcriptional regulator [Conservatibacter flavescens]|uniref:HTH araC/xylS-type domain-containing protein n=1 Tax=Conservatibacter flavescens TaxID=28161 RepID=A0A2M8S4J5_9PAST|nr:AraC family transcriptional regulator [Conservatibacter flavescens]PJG86069.1 hypothetical protein CVP05_02555 [Conservatibacter flavescens]